MFDSFSFVDLIGVSASGFVVLTFYVKNLVRLRTYAIVSNVLFTVYAVCLQLWPIAVLHSLLLPLNAVRLLELLERDEWLFTDEHPLDDALNQGRNMRITAGHFGLPLMSC